jgi:ABC-type phosphate transport system permease subunit
MLPMKQLLSLLALALTLPFAAAPLAFAQEEATPEAVETVPTSIADYTTGIPTTVYYYIGGLLVFFILYFVVTKVVKNKGDAFKFGQFAEIEQKSEAEKEAMLDFLFDKEGVLHTFSDLLKGEKIVGIKESLPYQTAG